MPGPYAGFFQEKKAIGHIYINAERYRSGHNGGDSKSSVRSKRRTVGSNPTLSATISVRLSMHG